MERLEAIQLSIGVDDIEILCEKFLYVRRQMIMFDISNDVELNNKIKEVQQLLISENGSRFLSEKFNKQL